LRWDDVGDPVRGVRHPKDREPVSSANKAVARGLTTFLDASKGGERDEKKQGWT
jgi:hypothetical protein